MMEKVEPRLYGLFGDPVAHSLSPDLQNEAFRLLGVKGVYLKFRIKPEELGMALEAVRVLQFGGVNITIPHNSLFGSIGRGCAPHRLGEYGSVGGRTIDRVQYGRRGLSAFAP